MGTRKYGTVKGIRAFELPDGTVYVRNGRGVWIISLDELDN